MDAVYGVEFFLHGSKTGIAGSNPIPGMCIGLCLFLFLSLAHWRVGLQALDKTFVPTYKTTRRRFQDDVTLCYNF